MASCDIQKYFMLIYAIGQNQLNVDLDLKSTPLSLSLHLRSLPLSPIHNILFSLSVLSAKFPDMFYLYWFHIKSEWYSNTIIIVWLTINVWGCTCCLTYTANTIHSTNVLLSGWVWQKKSKMLRLNRRLGRQGAKDRAVFVQWICWSNTVQQVTW